MFVFFDSTTSFLQVVPGAKDLTNAVTLSLSDLDVGDRILARGQIAGNAGSFAATSIIVMSKEDIAKKHTAERAEWEKRGIGGVITALHTDVREININMSTSAGLKPLVISFAPGAVLRRYAPDSIKFNDARLSSFAELKVGDQVKALGTSNEDGSRFIAEQLISGSFRSIAGAVISTDPGRGIILITDLATKKRIELQVTSDSTVQRLTEELAQSLARRIQSESSPDRSAGTVEGNRSRPAGEAARGRGPGQGRSSSTLQSAIEKLPRLKLEDLHPGESVLISCTNSEDPSRGIAIALLAGIEPLLRASSQAGRALDLGSWNVDLNMNAIVP
jgi:hypothetical protein